MNERLMQFIWQHCYFSTAGLFTTRGEPVTVIKQGTINFNQGPDFLNAQISINGTLWAGNIELHVRSSDWHLHKHADDIHYSNIILHVVWIDDTDTSHLFPVLELQQYVSKLLLQQYEKLMQQERFISCATKAATVNQLTWNAWLDSLMAERLLARAELMLHYFSGANNNWETTCWHMVAAGFGSKVNGEAFGKIARSVPLTVLARHKLQIHQLEALLLGQAGQLQGEAPDDYIQMLQKEYRFLRKKYQLPDPGVALQFLRMRPSAFPTIRLAQLAMLIHKSNHLFSSFINAASVKELVKLLEVQANDYWHYHYKPGDASAFKIKRTGSQLQYGLIINTIAPLVFAYGHYYCDDAYKQKAIHWLESTPAEQNTITRKFAGIGIKAQTAGSSQAMIQLKNNYCNARRCLDCAVGNSILKRMY